VAAKTQFGGENPLSALRILYYLVLNVEWRDGSFHFTGNNKITFDLIYRPLERREESYLAIWLLRSRNLQRVSLPKVKFLAYKPFVDISVNAHWRHAGRKTEATDDLEVLANYMCNSDRWELNEWLLEARAKKVKVAYDPPSEESYGCFKVNLTKIAGEKLLPVEPDLTDIFKWGKSYSARLWART